MKQNIQRYQNSLIPEMSSKKWILQDKMSSTHAEYFKASIHSYFKKRKPLGPCLPNGYHFLYLNPKYEETKLSKDGYDSHQNPEGFEFKRRLWVGGQLDFLTPMPFNTETTCLETIKNSKTYGNNNIINIMREIISDGQTSLIEKRLMLYTSVLYQKAEPQKAPNSPLHTHVLKPTDILLFRYSGLTFNSHKIHYDKEYAQKEGYPGLLVHGPLSITLLLEWFSILFEKRLVKSFKYKNIAPLFANENMKLGVRSEKKDKFEIWIENSNSELCVSGTIDAVPNQ